MLGMRFICLCLMGLTFFYSCHQKNKDYSDISNNFKDDSVENEKRIVETHIDSTYFKLFENNPNFISKKFDFPVGKPNAVGYYNAQKFKENNHLGDDWNGKGGGNSDLGDSIYAIANGYVSEAIDYGGGWGNVVRIIHQFDNKLYESVYAHCDTILVKENKFIKRGDKIATIGNCNGIYYAHLHLEIRDSIQMSIGGGYSDDTRGYLNPTAFIKKHR